MHAKPFPKKSLKKITQDRMASPATSLGSFCSWPGAEESKELSTMKTK
jgi:hypothetical protein